MAKILLSLIVTVLLCITIEHYQAVHIHTDSKENRVETNRLNLKKQSVYRDRYIRRVRRQNEGSISNTDTAATVLSILPLDRIGAIVGQIMSTGLKEMFNPDVGKKLVNVLENQAPLLLTSLFTNLYSTLRDPVKPAPPPAKNTATSPTSVNDAVKQLSNSSTSDLMNALRRPNAK